MCGIAGWVGAFADDGSLARMTGVMAHRGPDGQGTIAIPLGDGSAIAALGHRRLSIIDLSGGAQPMASADGRFTIVFNGEIYNYVELREELVAKGALFLTNSDTEVILEAWRAWGEDSLNRLRGMFAFALHDASTGEVHLARDPFGKKPILLWQSTHGGRPITVFASEMAGLLAHPLVRPMLNEKAIYDYLVWRYVPSPETFFKGIRKLGPGSVLTLRASGEASERRFFLPPEEAPAGATPEDPVAAFRDIFDEAVRLRLRADVPLGAFLSSGLDSASIVATLGHLGAPDIRTYSIGYAGDPGSEVAGAAATAAALGTRHTSMEFDAPTLKSLMPALSRHLGAPLAETACVPIYLMSREASKDVKILLSGEGADEMFGGYPKHRVEARLGGLPPWILGAVGRGALATTRPAANRFRRARIAARALTAGDFEHRMVAWFGALSPAERRRIWRGPPQGGDMSRIPFAAGSSPLRRVLHFDQTSWLPDNLLERVDRMTMAASIEARAPYMDTRLAAFSATLPDEWRVQGGVGKRIIRAAMADRLPSFVLERPKIGFRLPVADWFRRDLAADFRERLLDTRSVSSEWIDRDAVRALFEGHGASRANHDKTLWALYALEVFLAEFFG
jgi:asparagine synthase (glutamine-hydrolysing)